MDSVIILTIRIAMLAVLWFFVLLAVRAVKKSTDVPVRGAVASGRTAAVPGAVAGASKGDHVRGGLKLGGQPPVTAIEVVNEQGAGNRYEIGNLSEIVLGRSPESTIRIPDDYASSRHAVLRKNGSDWVVEDLSSRNGTFLGDYQIDQPEKVGPGSVIRIGRTYVKLVA